MLENKTPGDFFVDLAKSVALRYTIHDEAKQEVRIAYVQALRGINWQVVLNSENTAEAVMGQMEIKGVSRAMLMNLTSAFLFRGGLVDNNNAKESLATRLAASLTWVRNDPQMQGMGTRLTAPPERAVNVFRDCPWMMFLYLLSMTDLISALGEADPQPPKA